MVWKDNIPLAAEPITSLPYVGGKIARPLSMKKEMGFKAYWNGACSGDKIRKFAPMGMDGFVLGTTMLFGKGRPYGEVIEEIRGMRIMDHIDRG